MALTKPIPGFPPRSRTSPKCRMQSDAEGHRLGSRGAPAPAGTWELYVGSRGKRITNPALKHVQNPIRLWKC